MKNQTQYSTLNFFDQSFIIKGYSNPKSRQGPGLGALASRVAPVMIYSTCVSVETSEVARTFVTFFRQSNFQISESLSNDVI